MAEAEDEIIERMPEEANAIRKRRLEIEQALKDGTEEYKVSLVDLMYTVAENAMLEETL